MTPDPIHVFIVDDHTIVRRGIAGMLSDSAEVDVIGEAGNGHDALQTLRDMSPDVVLMDLRMPGLDGSSVIAELRKAGNLVPVLVLTTYDTDADILRAIEAGANGYLLKDASRDVLVGAISTVARGESWLAPGIASRMMAQLRSPKTDLVSQRELDVLRLVAEGLSNKEIGAAIHISQATVKSHLIHIYRKLDVSDRTSAVRVGLERNLIQLNKS